MNFSLEWNFIWSFGGLGKEQGNTLSRQWNWRFFPLSCHILGEKPRVCLQEAEMWPRLMKETLGKRSHSPWKSLLSQIWMKTWSSLASSRRVDLLTFEYSSHCWGQHPLRKCLLQLQLFRNTCFPASWRIFFSVLVSGPLYSPLFHHCAQSFAVVALLNPLRLLPHCGRSVASPLGQWFSRRWFCPPEAIWQSLETFLIVMPEDGGCVPLASSG